MMLVRNRTNAKSASHSSALWTQAATIAALVLCLTGQCIAATTLAHYYAHDAVEDQYGVIAPWYTGLNGPADMRIRIAAETMKRYPWTSLIGAVDEVPHYMFNSNWNISGDGVTITPLPLSDWACGDLGDRSAHVLLGFAQYYAYSGDPAAIAHMSLLCDLLLDHCQTPSNNSWPSFLISVPLRGEPYGDCDPDGLIQLDMVSSVGQGMLKAYQLTGNTRWFEGAKHWADVLAEKRNRTPGADPWSRYANPEDAPWSGDVRMTGGVAYILTFLDDLIRLGYTGTNNSIVETRDAARAYLHDTLLPAWEVNDTWGRNYWDWANPVQGGSVTRAACRYIMANKDYFPNWRNDVRNIVSLLLNHTGVYTASYCEVYSGAWAYPESLNCCGSSLWYLPLEQVNVWAQYGVEADSDWAREQARRIETLCTYDINANGLSEDNIFGGVIVNGEWFKIAHPQALNHMLTSIGWMPELFGASRENHIVRTSGVVTSVVYGKGSVTYSTYDAPANTVDVLRLAFVPTGVTANGSALSERADLNANGYTCNALSNGDCVVTVRHDNATSIVITGPDPQSVADDQAFSYTGSWSSQSYYGAYLGSLRATGTAGASATYSFVGSQVRLIGRVATDGGLADVYIDGVKQLVGIDFWNPSTRDQQVVYYLNGLSNATHQIKVVASGTHHGRSTGANVYLDSVQWSNATGKSDDGVGGGPTEAQRWVFGYPGRDDITDSAGNKWKPATEFIVPLGANIDSVAQSWWRTPVASISGTSDPDLYKYGVHSPELVANFIVGPGKYHARLKFAVTRGLDPVANTIDILINGERVVGNMDVAATAGGINKAVDLVFNNITPRNGVVDIRFVNPGGSGQAFVQAIEVGPGDGGVGATPVSAVAQLTGTVRKDGQPLSGATVTAGGKSATTGTNGVYTIVDVDITSSMTQITASAAGCWPENRFAALVSDANTVDFDLRALPGNQLLTNGDFEDPGAPYIKWGNSGGAQGSSGWACKLWSSDEAYLRRESTVFRYNSGLEPDSVGPGPWEPFSGTQCSRQTTNAAGQIEISQTVWAVPISPYKASVMTKLVNAGVGDYVSLQVQELDVNDNVVADHTPVVSTNATAWIQLADNFTTTASTAKIRYALYTSVSVPWSTGWANYDCAVLDGLAGVSQFADVTGVVKAGSTPVSGAVVTVGSKTAISGSNGAYSISDVVVTGELAAVNVQYPGYLSENRWRTLVRGANAIDFDLVALPVSNLLANPGFEDDQAPYIAYEGAGAVRTDQSWTTRLSTVRGNPYTSYLRRESSYYRSADEPYGLGNGPWTPHSGTEASRHCTSSQGHHRVYQDIAATPGKLYRASVWLKAMDVDSYGFGVPGSGDSAGLHIIELAADGSTVLDHTPVIITSPTDYTRLTKEFATQAGTAKVRFMMETYIGGSWLDYGHWQHGWVTYDDAALECSPPTTVPTIAALNAMADETRARVCGKVVTSAFGGFFYIEESDRTSGIKVTGTAAAGNIVDVIGTIRTVNGERTLLSESVSAATGGIIPKPLGMSNRSAIPQAQLSVVGLYVTIWGRVDAVGGSSFTLTDGSGAYLRVYAPSGYSAAPNDYVKVIGALGAEMSGSAVQPVVRAVSVTKAD